MMARATCDENGCNFANARRVKRHPFTIKKGDLHRVPIVRSCRICGRFLVVRP